jgi:iron complex transport system ATP-binding protein
MQVLKAIFSLVAEGRTLVMTSHQPEHALACGGSALLLSRDEGKTVSGPVQEVITATSLSDLYRVPFNIAETPSGPVAAPDYTILHAASA